MIYPEECPKYPQEASIFNTWAEAGGIRGCGWGVMQFSIEKHYFNQHIMSFPNCNYLL